jgi:hypothetical protein
VRFHVAVIIYVAFYDTREASWKNSINVTFTKVHSAGFSHSITFILYINVTWGLKASAELGFAEHVPVATRNRPLLDNELLKQVSRQRTQESKRCSPINTWYPAKQSTGALRGRDLYSALSKL